MEKPLPLVRSVSASEVKLRVGLGVRGCGPGLCHPVVRRGWATIAVSYFTLTAKHSRRSWESGPEWRDGWRVAGTPGRGGNLGLECIMPVRLESGRVEDKMILAQAGH